MSESEQADWQTLAEALETHGIDPRRAQVVALAAETDLTYQEIADTLGVSSKGSIGNQIRAYRETKANAEWLAENAPDV